MNTAPESKVSAFLRTVQATTVALCASLLSQADVEHQSTVHALFRLRGHVHIRADISELIVAETPGPSPCGGARVAASVT